MYDIGLLLDVPPIVLVLGLRLGLAIDYVEHADWNDDTCKCVACHIFCLCLPTRPPCQYAHSQRRF